MKIAMLKSSLWLSVLLLVGCSTLTEWRLDFADKVFGREPLNAPAELKEISFSQTAKIVWSQQLGDTGNYDYIPALEAGFVFAANAEGDLVKLDANSGQQLWTVNIEEPISGGVGAGGGLVLVGSNRGNIFAYDMAGELVWKSQLSSEILSAPRYFDGKVIARSGDNKIYGLDAADGSRKWVYERKVPALSLRSSAGIVIDSGAVYAGFSGGKMAAIRADNGKLLWETTVAVPKGVTEIERIADITSLPVVAGPVVYAVAYQGRVAAINRVNGKVLWNRQISSYTGMSYADEKLYVSHALGSVYSLDYATGRTFWRQGDLLNRRITAPVLTSNMLVVGDLEGYVHFLDIDDGKFITRKRVDSNAIMSVIPGEIASEVIVSARDGGLFSVQVSEKASIPQERPAIESVEQPDDEIDDLDAGPDEAASEQEDNTVKPEPQPDDEFSQSEPSDALDEVASEQEGNMAEPAPQPDDEFDQPELADEDSRSILFKKDAILLPDSEQSGPGIVLPKSE